MQRIESKQSTEAENKMLFKHVIYVVLCKERERKIKSKIQRVGEERFNTELLLNYNYFTKKKK